VPRVSVLLPVRDAEDTLVECLDSLAEQSLVDHEVVVVNDGSRDSSAEILESRSAADPRIRALHTRPLGLVPALNRCLEEATGPVVARMDADDVAHPARLERQVERLAEDPATGVVACAVELVSAPGVAPSGGMRRYVEWSNGLLDHDAMFRDRFVEAPLVHPSAAMRRETLTALGGWRDIDGPEDYDLWLRAFEAGHRFAKLGDVLLRWRDRPGRLTRADPRYSPGRFLALKVAALCRGPLVPGRGAVVWGAGPVGKSWARALQAAGHPVAAFVEVDPDKIGERIHGAPVVGVPGAGGLRGPLHLAAVGQPGARERIRAEAHRLGLVEEEDLVAVA